MKSTTSEKQPFTNATSTFSEGTHMFPMNFALPEKQNPFLLIVCFHKLGIFFKSKMHVLQSHATIFGRNIILFQVKLLVFQKCHVFCRFLFATRYFLQEVLCFIRWYALLHVYTWRNNKYYLIEFPRKVTCFNCFSGMLTIETKCIFCLLSNAAPFEWECLFDKHAPVNQFFSRRKMLFPSSLKKNSVLIGFFRLEESTQRWNFLMGVKSIQLTEGTIKMDAFPEECVQNAVFPDLRSKICPGVLGES